MNTSAGLPFRYPGLKPFERSQSNLFYGRGEDIQRLTNLIVRERLTVLFAKSGIGKTSLLQAGVAPELEQQNFAPLFLRIDNTAEPIASVLSKALRNHPLAAQRDETPPDAPLTLWEWMKRLEFDLDGLPATPVLVLDQFEETFTLLHTERSRSEFLAQLADLANEAMPEAIRADLLHRFQQGDPALTPQMMQWWEQQPNIRIVLSIRSDFLHLLDEISPLIPGILRNRYQLQALNRRQARQSIEAPAKAEGEYASVPFAYEDAAVNTLLDFLAGRKEDQDKAADATDVSPFKRQDEIESFNLQIICRHIEELIISDQKKAGFVVTPPFYGGLAGLEREISDFYAKQLRAFPELYARRTERPEENKPENMLTAQRLIEESLVTPIGRRCSMVDDFLTVTWKVPPEFLDTLVDCRLLRKELRLNDFYYEISHDTLLPAVLRSRDERRKLEKADQEKAELQASLQEEALKRKAIEGELASAIRQRKLARKVGLLSAILLVLSLLFGAWFTSVWIENLKEELDMAERNCRNELFDAAIPAYDGLAAYPPKRWAVKTWAYKDPAAESADTRRLQLVHLNVTAQIARGDSLFFDADYAGALDAYRHSYDSLQLYAALNYPMRLPTQEQTHNPLKISEEVRDTLWRIDPAKINERERTLRLRMDNARKTIIDRFTLRQKDAESFIEAGAWGLALRNFYEMKRLLPIHPDDAKKLQESLNMRAQKPANYVESEIRKYERLLSGG